MWTFKHIDGQDITWYSTEEYNKQLDKLKAIEELCTLTPAIDSEELADSILKIINK